MFKFTTGQDIELNDKFREALRLMEETNKNVFITGRAGTGKSTLLSLFRENTKKSVAVLAPTGVAAVNINGQTIHSFFGFRPDITVSKVKREYKNRSRRGLYKKLDAILIDEISMVRADLLDCVDEFLRLNGKDKQLSFGGTQMIFIGDLYQLCPVVVGEERKIFRSYYASPYFFDAKVFVKLDIETVELEKIYRQSDSEFIRLLNAVRNRSVTEDLLEMLNSRLDENFEADKNEFYIYLTTTNAKAGQVNEYELEKLKSDVFEYEGQISGEFNEKSLPTGIYLNLKIGAQIMLVNNDRAGRWVNGTVGKIVDIEHDEDLESDTIFVELADGEVVDVTPYTWEMFRFAFNNETNRLESETIGSFTQYPIILAWAVTIHKSQGKTFEKVIIDIDRGTFAHGQTYVALSRCTCLTGIVLKKPIEKKHILLDWRVVKFLTNRQYELADAKMSVEEKTELIEKAIKKKQKLTMTYLKANDEKSEREILPEFVGEMEYKGVTYLGMEGHCFKRCDTRVFRVDRILSLNLSLNETGNSNL